MNKTAIKNFAIWARNKLIADINYRAGLLGITKDGIHSALPQSTGQTQFFDIGTAEPYAITGEQIYQRQHLVDLLRQKEKESDYKTAYKYVLEEVAYTWFNRLIAVRFMEVNDYLPSHIRVLSSESGKMEPDLVTTPFDADLEFSIDEQQTILDLKNANKLDEVFRMLFIKQCNALNEILPALFEKTSDYTELLLNLSVIDQDGVVWHLVHDIPEADFNVGEGGQVEIIGWLYQYYNTEPKNEAFAKKGKITKDEVPAVTQLFTPDWIVRYMVENSLGRLWVEGHPNEELKSNWKYYLEEAEQEPKVAAQLEEIRKEYAKLNPEDIRVIDPCMGSGHILVYAFDVLMQLHKSAGYGQRDAARNILENNIYGLDIDDRAFQMAYFAVMMKARQYNRRILNGEYRPNVYSIQESNGINRNQLKYFGKGLNELEKNNAINQIMGLLDTFVDAKEYGSILNVDFYDWDLLIQFIENIDEPEQIKFEFDGIEETQARIIQIIRQGRTLERKYEITITNPPYMSNKSMDQCLLSYVQKKYPDSKADMFAVFIEKCADLTRNKGFQSMITQHSWMFLSSFEKMRIKLARQVIINMTHLGPRAFDEISGEVVQTSSFVYLKCNLPKYISSFCRLVDGNNERQKEKKFLEKKDIFHVSQERFESIGGRPFAYWASSRALENFNNARPLIEYSRPRVGQNTGDNERFLRLWYEIAINKIGFNITHEKLKETSYKWIPYNKGGSFRRWYGNFDRVVNWENDGKEIKEYAVIRNHGKHWSRYIQNIDNLCREGISWSDIASTRFACRYLPEGFICDVKGSSTYPPREYRNYIMAFLNSKIAIYYLQMLNPTTTFQVGNIGSLPLLVERVQDINRLANENVMISKDDWDSYETSWDFSKHPLLTNDTLMLIEEGYKQWYRECNLRFMKLKENEISLNKIFAEIYGLDNEIEANVKDNDVTVNIPTISDTIKSFLSYAVGCMFGRYSLNNEGLSFAGGMWNKDQYISFLPDEDNVIPITDEEYLEDDIVSRLCAWLKVVYCEETLEENLDFIAKALGNKGTSSRDIIRNYFLNDFFKDHCQTYSVTGSGKRPIYWLFDSGKQNGFKALIYLHRYTADTIGNLRIDYLHRMQRIYESEINRMQDMIEHSTSAREAVQATKRREKLTKQLKECREYDEKLAHLALSRIELDLDDGVKVNYRKLQTANDGKFYEVLADSKNIMSKK